MKKFTEYISSQFGNPRGFIGFLCCKMMNIINRRMYVKTISILRLSKDSKLLDVGYGNGYLLKSAFNAFGCKLYGIDVSADMKSLALKRNVNAAKKNKIELLVGDCCNLPFEDGCFDAVTTINTVYFWNDTQKGFDEIFRCLKDGGVFLNVFYSKKWLDSLAYTKTGFKKFESAELAEFALKAGFAEVRIEEISKDKSFVLICKKA